MIFRIALGIFSLCTLAQAAKKPPELPAPGIDLQYEETPGNFESVIDVIARHRKNSDCRGELSRSVHLYAEAKQNLKARVAAGASADDIDSAEKVMRQARAPMLLNIEKCGPCVTHPVTKPIIIKKQVWWVSDGSCQLEGDAKTLQAAYEKISNSLLHLPEYPKHALDAQKPEDDGGFFYVLPFSSQNPTGHPIPIGSF